MMKKTSCALAAACILAASAAHADPGDFGAMPGLWKIQVHRASEGAAPAKVQWHCVDEGADPWTTFAAWTPGPAADCTAASQHRASTSLKWTLNCKATPGITAHVDFDSAKHYTGAVAGHDGKELTRVEGERVAACTSPQD